MNYIWKKIGERKGDKHTRTHEHTHARTITVVVSTIFSALVAVSFHNNVFVLFNPISTVTGF